MTPEQQARVTIDNLLQQAGWAVQDSRSANLYAATGVAVREFRLKPGHGQADYLLYVDQKVVGVVEAKPVGRTLTGVELQSEKYGAGLPDNLPAHRRPLPFLYESTGQETQFTNRLDPEPRSRNVFAFHTPDAAGRVARRRRGGSGRRAPGCRISRRLSGAAQPAARAAEHAGPERGRPVGRAGEGY